MDPSSISFGQHELARKFNLSIGADTSHAANEQDEANLRIVSHLKRKIKPATAPTDKERAIQRSIDNRQLLNSDLDKWQPIVEEHFSQPSLSFPLESAESRFGLITGDAFAKKPPQPSPHRKHDVLTDDDEAPQETDELFRAIYSSLHSTNNNNTSSSAATTTKRRLGDATQKWLFTSNDGGDDEANDDDDNDAAERKSGGGNSTQHSRRETFLAGLREERMRREQQARLTQKRKREKRIKSKSFHRHMKHRAVAQYEAETERLRESDPAEFVRRVAAANDQARLQERASLRHKVGGKFAKNARLLFKYSASGGGGGSKKRGGSGGAVTQATRNAMDEMLELGRKLEAKPDEDGDAEEEEEEEREVDYEEALGGADEEEEEEEESDEQESEEEKEDDEEDGGDKNQMETSPSANQNSIKSTLKSVQQTLSNQKRQKLDVEEEEDESVGNYLTAAAAMTQQTQLHCGNTDEVDPEIAQQADEEFAQEKAAVTREEQPADLDQFMPGWNSWTGPDTQDAEVRKRARLRNQLVHRAPQIRRRDRFQSRVIFRENVGDDGLRKHQPVRIPYPYKNAREFEKSIARPVSRAFLGALESEERTRPRIHTQMGRVILPMDRRVAMRHAERCEN